jgi:hypothetical protein
MEPWRTRKLCDYNYIHHNNTWGGSIGKNGAENVNLDNVRIWKWHNNARHIILTGQRSSRMLLYIHIIF